MTYKINIYFNNNILNSNLEDFILQIKNNFELEHHRLVFFNNLGIEEFDALSINSYLELNIKHNKSFENVFDNFLNLFNFVDSYHIIENKSNNKDYIYIKSIDIDNLIDEIDKIYYIRSKLQKYTLSIDNKEKLSYSNLLKDLSLTKYNLKYKALSLRIIDIEYELDKIKNTITAEAKTYSLDFNINFKYEDIKIDKIIFYKIKSSIIDLLLLIVSKAKSASIPKKLTLNFEIYQNFNEIYFEIYSSLSLNYITKYINNPSTHIEEDMKYISNINTLKSIGKVYINEEDKFILKIEPEFLILNALIVENNRNYYAIDINQISSIHEINQGEILNIDSKEYFTINGINYPILNKSKELNKIICVKINNQHFALLVSKILYKEEIYVRKFDNFNNKYIGDSLLKDTKKALVINLKGYIWGAYE